MENENTNLEGNEELSVEEVFSVLDFAKAAFSGFAPQIGAVTPQMLARAMKDISFSPRELSSDDLTKALKSPKESEDILRSFMEYLEIVSMPMKRVLSYMLSHLAFDLTYTVYGDLKDTEYKSAKYKKDLEQFHNFLDDFEWHGQFRKAIRQMLRNEMFVFTPRDDGDKIVLQELPLDRCKLTGRWDYGFLVNFDFSYFLIPGVDIRLYPKFFRDTYYKIFGEGSSKPYVPATNPHDRGFGNGEFAYWVDLPPDVAWAFKMDESLATSIPYFSGLMPELLEQPVIRALQKNANMAAASKMVLGQVPMRTGSKTSVKDMIAIDATMLGQFMALLQSALSSSIKIASAPLENMKGVEFKSEEEIYNSYLKTALSSSGLNSAIFFTGNLKANTIETQLSFESDHLIMDALYNQFNLFFEYFGNKDSKWYRFLPQFEGNNYYLNRQQRFNYAKELAAMGILLPQKIAASRGMKPHHLEKQMKMAKLYGDGFDSLLTPISGAVSGAGGRPALDDSELSDKGEGTRGDGGNIAKGGNA